MIFSFLLTYLTYALISYVLQLSKIADGKSLQKRDDTSRFSDNPPNKISKKIPWMREEDIFLEEVLVDLQ
jgi:hypothetical protein